MKKALILLLILAAAGVGYYAVTDTGEQPETNTGNQAETGSLSVTPIEHASGILSWGERTIYMDPVGDSQRYAEQDAPDLILLTHAHPDHLSTSTLAAVAGEGTIMLAPQKVADQLSQELRERTNVVANGETVTVNGLTINAIPMYNLPERNDAFHAKGDGNGYVVERNEQRVYIAGDTDNIPEMQNLQNIDIAFVPMNQPYTMTVGEAAEAVLAFAPEVVYPYHYRGQDGFSDVAQFRSLVNDGNSDIEVRLAEWYPSRATSDIRPSETPEGQVDAEIDLTGTNYAFSQETIRVQQGDTVQVTLTATEGFHDWVVDAFDAATERVRDGDAASVTFVADEAGEFEYYCSVGNHRQQGMVGTLIVE